MSLSCNKQNCLLKLLCFEKRFSHYRATLPEDEKSIPQNAVSLTHYVTKVPCQPEVGVQSKR